MKLQTFILFISRIHYLSSNEYILHMFNYLTLTIIYSWSPFVSQDRAEPAAIATFSNATPKVRLLPFFNKSNMT